MCHNCGASMGLAQFMKEVNPSLYEEYAIEKWKDGQSGKTKGNFEKDVDYKFDFTPTFKSKCSFDCGEKVSDLHQSHPAKKYCDQRNLPNKELSFILIISTLRILPKYSCGLWFSGISTITA